MPSKIEYVDETWNPVTGCTKVSPGCENCYAECMARRLAGRFGYPEAPRHFDVTLHPDRLDEPLRRKKPTRYLACSMGDLFHEDVPLEAIRGAWEIMARSRQHTFLVLTKRPTKMWSFITEYLKFYVPPKHIWLGVTVESQDQMWRVEELLKIPATKRWVSLEPMLGTVDMHKFLLLRTITDFRVDEVSLMPTGNFELGGAVMESMRVESGLDWVVLGGETGPGARPCHPDWVRKVRDDCAAAEVPFFFKNWGGWHPAIWLTDDGDIACIKAEYDNSEDVFGDGEYMLPVPHGQKSGRLLDGRTWDEMPEEE